MISAVAAVEVGEKRAASLIEDGSRIEEEREIVERESRGREGTKREPRFLRSEVSRSWDAEDMKRKFRMS